jgi:hypothetical protein
MARLPLATLVRGAKRQGVAISVFGNWLGSGNDLGSAFLTARTPSPARGQLDGAWRVVAAGQPAKSKAGVWLSGHSFSYPSKQTLERTASSAPLLVRALALTLAELGAATSGNVTLDADGVETWLSAG